MNIGIQTWGSDGDILPFVALAGGLRSAGNQVTLVITSVDGKDYRSLGERLDVRVKHVGGPAYDRKDFAALANEIGYERNPLKQFDLIVKRMFEPFVDEMYSASKALCEENGLLIGHVIHYPLQAAARKAGLPYVTVNLSPMGIPTGFRPPSDGHPHGLPSSFGDAEPGQAHESPPVEARHESPHQARGARHEPVQRRRGTPARTERPRGVGIQTDEPPGRGERIL
jgi:hypothetical protein